MPGIFIRNGKVDKRSLEKRILDRMGYDIE